jgi:hypothetical protein
MTVLKTIAGLVWATNRTAVAFAVGAVFFAGETVAGIDSVTRDV